MIGERLAEIRKDHGDKQIDLAQKLNVSLSTIRSWEQELTALRDFEEFLIYRKNKK